MISIAASAREIGQPSFARSAISRTLSSERPETSIQAVSAERVMPTLGSKLTAACTRSSPGSAAGADEAVAELHRKAGGVRRGDELLGVRLLVDLIDARLPGDAELGQRTRPGRDDAALAVEQPADPLDLRAAHRHYAITSMRRAAGASPPSRSSTSRRARMDTSS